MVGIRTVQVLAVTAGSICGLSGATYSLLSDQAKRAKAIIGLPEGDPHNADGVYLPNGRGPLPADHPRAAGALTFAVLGDSAAAGLGAESADALPGVLIARGLAEEANRPVRLTTYAISGSTTADLAAQTGRALNGTPPDVVLVIIGGNDVTARMRVGTSAEMLATEVARLRAAGCAVVVGTCPDLGAIRPIPQPLRSIAKKWSRALAKAQRVAVQRAGGNAVALADLLGEFHVRTDLFSSDQFHPNDVGYEMAASVLLAPLCSAANVWEGTMVTS
ncbi:lysophospholipase L1-like esterase [Herbihabitans rhizosphaerae]|uniref:Lysophospholipase L1-like esterase n=1 Tax=Herbihabitans rhizosphaerae TaxID=1872711 RepID=A0A4Q7KK88_9PSEU|nr:SGNH/GDSL hydrolase family protein [Herbihabitans rhizosphaerae]RZS36969.1 lysophospholipase L1-like esterase [Herbihabitans rhizosphaerae]